MNLKVYRTTHIKNRRISEAFAAGCGAEIVPPGPLRSGAVFVYGCLRGTKEVVDQAKAAGRTWYYADNGYFRPGMDGYFKVTKNALQHDGSGQFGPERWRRLGKTIHPWRADGEHILICPPSMSWGEIWGFDPMQWLADVLERLSSSTDRPLHIRHRENLDTQLHVALDNAWAMVTHSSNAAVEALLWGIPVFCTDPCGAYRMGTPDLSRIENPPMPDDRELWQWACNLAANQWTIQEMRDGTCWRELKDR